MATPSEILKITDNADKINNWCPIFTSDQQLFIVGNQNDSTNSVAQIFTHGNNRLFVQDHEKTYELIGAPTFYSKEEINSEHATHR